MCVWVGGGQIKDTKFHILASIINEGMRLWPQISLGNVGNRFYIGHVDEYLQGDVALGLARWAVNPNYLVRHPAQGYFV